MTRFARRSSPSSSRDREALMANVKELRGRIKSVSNIAQITKAMEMVASMKLRKVQARALSSRPYTEEIVALGRHLSDCVSGDAELPLFKAREVKTVGVFLVSSDRGLCGAYNANVTSRLHRFIDEQKSEHGRDVKLYIYGRKGYGYFYRRGFDVEKFFVEARLGLEALPALVPLPVTGKGKKCWAKS